MYTFVFILGAGSLNYFFINRCESHGNQEYDKYTIVCNQ